MPDSRWIAGVVVGRPPLFCERRDATGGGPERTHPADTQRAGHGAAVSHPCPRPHVRSPGRRCRPPSCSRQSRTARAPTRNRERGPSLPLRPVRRSTRRINPAPRQSCRSLAHGVFGHQRVLQERLRPSSCTRASVASGPGQQRTYARTSAPASGQRSAIARRTARPSRHPSRRRAAILDRAYFRPLRGSAARADCMGAYGSPA